MDTIRTPSKDVVPDFVIQYIEKHPEEYKRAQEYGDLLMNSKFTNCEKYDITTSDDNGDEIMYRKLINDIKYYNMSEEDMSENEINILKNKLGDKYKELFISL